MDYLYRDELENFFAPSAAASSSASGENSEETSEGEGGSGGASNNATDDLRVAFSRAQESKVYVQHLLEGNAEETRELILRGGAHVYVCGGTGMGHDVNVALRKILAGGGGVGASNGVKVVVDDSSTPSEKEGEEERAAGEYLERMGREGRYVQELWSA